MSVWCLADAAVPNLYIKLSPRGLWEKFWETEVNTAKKPYKTKKKERKKHLYLFGFRILPVTRFKIETNDGSTEHSDESKPAVFTDSDVLCIDKESFCC